LPNLEPAYDLIYLDADKINYPQYFSPLKALLGQGAWWIVDNVLWNGKVFEIPAYKMDPDTAAITAFNEKIRSNPSLEKVMLPVRDGLYLIRKRL
jgi:caffeoyl-CoA O-methyltransferase